MEARRSEDAARVAAMVTRHHETLLRTARGVSLCSDDAHDAVQRALEIYLRRLGSLDPATELAWLKVVVRHEALAVRRARGHGEPLDPEAEVSPARDPDDHAASAERVARSAEALERLKPDEARGLLAASLGMSYREIGQQFQWTYTKTNRVITEGRARFLELFGRLERGEECENFASALAVLAQRRGAGDEVVGLRSHLRGCSSCRATLRALHGSPRSRIAAAVVLPWRWLADRLGQAKAEVYGAASRVSELAAAAPAGGGRGAAATALVGLCLGGAGSYCAAAGVFDGTRDAPERAVAAERERPAPAPAHRLARPRAEAPVVRPATPAKAPAPVREERPIRAGGPQREPVPSTPEAATGDVEFAVAESRPAPPPREFAPTPEPEELTSPQADFETRQPPASSTAEFGG